VLRNKLITWLLYPLARRLKRWASAILAAETIESEVLPRLATEDILDAHSDARTESGPPAHWLKRIPSSHSLHWVELRRSVTPELLQQPRTEVIDATSSPRPPARRPVRSAGPPPPLRLERPRNLAVTPSEPSESSARQRNPEASANKEHQATTSDHHQTTARPEPTQERERSNEQPLHQVRNDSPMATSASSSRDHDLQPIYSADHPVHADESDQKTYDKQRRTRQASRSMNSRPEGNTATQRGAGLPVQLSRPSQQSSTAGEFADEIPTRIRDQIEPEQTASPAIPPPGPPTEISHTRRQIRNMKEDWWLKSTPAEPPYPIETLVETRRAPSSSAAFPEPQPELIYPRQQDDVKWNQLADRHANEDRAVTKQSAAFEPPKSAPKELFFRAGSSIPGSTSTGLWPDLPEATSISYADELSETLRALARRQRVEREQTGSIWSE
jgi:hypothetical protein